MNVAPDTRPPGRPRRVNDAKVAEIRRLAAAGLPYKLIAAHTGLSRQFVSAVARGIERQDVAP